MTKTYNKKQREIFREFWRKRADIIEEMFWVGCNPEDQKMFKKQAEDGFKLMFKMSKLAKEYMEKINKAE